MIAIESNADKNATQGRIAYLDAMRIIACFGVIFTHSAETWRHTSFPSGNWESINLLISIARWSGAVFIMISGALFLNPAKNFSISKLLSKNILHILIAYLTWSAIYELLFFADDLAIKPFLLDVLIGNAGHLWFIKMLLGLYLITPMLRVIVADKRLEQYFLALSLLIGFVVNRNLELLEILNCSFTSAFRSIVVIFDYLGIHKALAYAGYFVLGHYLNTYVLPLKAQKNCYIAGIVSTVAILILTSAYSHHIDSPSRFFYDMTGMNVLLQSIAAFTFIKQHCNSPFFKKRLVFKLSKMSMGIYLVHMAFIYSVRTMGITSSTIHPLILVPCLSITVFTLSYCVSWLLSRIPVIRDYMV